MAETVIHEFGHYFGMSEEQIEEIEEKYWRGESTGRRLSALPHCQHCQLASIETGIERSHGN